MKARLWGKQAGKHTSGSAHESSFMIRLMRESGSSCRGTESEFMPFCASGGGRSERGWAMVQWRLWQHVTTCSVSRVSHKWFIRSTCVWSFGDSAAGSALFLVGLSCAGSTQPGCVGAGTMKLTNVCGSAGKRSSPKVGTSSREPDGRRGSRSLGAPIESRERESGR